MSHNQFKFKEEILHTLWANQEFAQSVLCTDKGLTVKILDPGMLNRLDGPDFLGAKIRIGKIVHHGAVEIHLKSKDWYSHNHHQDSNYDHVILHVVSDDSSITPVVTSKGISPPTINISRLLPNYYQKVIGTSRAQLPCKNLIQSISPNVFERQVNLAHLEYLEYKVSTFFEYFNENEITSTAWKQALFITISDALGVPSNRDTMKRIATSVIDGSMKLDEKSILASEVVSNWNKKGNRFCEKPVQRVKQLIKLHRLIFSKPFDFFFTTSAQNIWIEILNACGLTKTKHNHRLFVSFLLPAMYALGVIIHSNKLKILVKNLWNSSQIEIPKSILQKFGIFNSGDTPQLLKRIGLIHQYNAYCKPLNCSKCEVLNKAISS